MTHTATKQQPEMVPAPGLPDFAPEEHAEHSRQWQADRLRLLWAHRRLFAQVTAIAVLLSAGLAFLLPRRFTSVTRLMPPDSQSNSTMAMVAAFAAKGGGLGSFAGDLLGLKSTGALFIGILRSQTAQDRLVEQFGLKDIYGESLMSEARRKLDEKTSISEDRKSGIISIGVTDSSPQRATALAAAYIDQLNSLVAELSTSSAHRERIFLEDRLTLVKQDLDRASNQLAQFSSKTNTLDIQQQGKAMLDAAANLAGQLVAARAQLEGLRQIYTDSSPRVQAVNGRVAELQRQLEKLSGVNNSAPATPSVRGDPGALPYPSIRNLPLLGVQYADYYRRTKIQETVFELLTEQYELAKVQEAKETPSVRVLDPPRIPEKKSFPPRLMIVLSGACLAFVATGFWVMAKGRWQEVDSEDPRKIFAQELAGTLKAQMPLVLRNGNEVRARIFRGRLTNQQRHADAANRQ